MRCIINKLLFVIIILVLLCSSCGKFSRDSDLEYISSILWTKAYDAKIEGDTVVVSSDEVSEPAAVRYGWANNPVCNLYNKEGLPASPFRTDDWPGVTVDKK